MQKAIEGVRFQPWWATAEHPNVDGVRLLILGESHYEEPQHGLLDGSGDRADMTQYVVRHYGLEANERQVFFTNLHRTLLGDENTEADRQRLWSNAFFYNYVQALVSAGGGKRPTAKQFREAEAAFREVLEAIRPTAILVCGRVLWHHLPKEDRTVSAPEVWGGVAAYRLRDGAEVFAAHTHHPSRGFNAALWRPRVAAFLDWVRRTTKK